MSDYIKELGIDSTVATQSDDTETNTEDFVQDSTTEESESEVAVNTETLASDGLQKQIDGLEKRLADKDEYIKLQREQLKTKDEPSKEVEVDTSTDFWDNPEKIVQDIQAQQTQTRREMQEMVVANRHSDYLDLVTIKTVEVALAADKDFADEFNKSSNVFETAYKYLSEKNTADKAKTTSLRDEVKAELLKEMGLDKPKKVGVPNMGKLGGNSTTDKSNASDDGFAAVFGNR